MEQEHSLEQSIFSEINQRDSDESARKLEEDARRLEEERREQEAIENESIRLQNILEKAAGIKGELSVLVELFTANGVAPHEELRIMGTENYRFYYGYLSFLKIGASNIEERPIQVDSKPAWILEETQQFKEIPSHIDEENYVPSFTSYSHDSVIGLTIDGELIKWEHYRNSGGVSRFDIFSDEELCSVVTEDKLVKWGADVLSAK